MKTRPAYIIILVVVLVALIAIIRGSKGRTLQGGGKKNRKRHRNADRDKILVAQSRILKLLNGESDKDWEVLGKITLEEAEFIRKNTNVDLSGYERIIDISSMNHVIKRHGDEEKEAKSGQVAVKPSDFLLIPMIVDNPDKVYYGGLNDRGLDTIKFVKQIGNTYYYVEEIRTGRQKVVLNTMYIKKGGQPH